MQTRDMLVGAALAVATVAPAAGHAATLMGNSVHAMYLAPDSTTVLQDLGVKVVGVSNPRFSDAIGGNLLNVDVTASQIVVSWFGSGTALTGAFSRFEFADLTHPFTEATLDTIGKTPGVALSFSGGDVFLNLSGAAHQSGQHVTVDVNTASVPEPAAWSMMLIGVAGVGTAMRARRRGTAARA